MQERPSASVSLMACGIVSGYSPPCSSVAKVRPVPSLDGSCGRFSGVIFSYLRVSFMACLSSTSAHREIGKPCLFKFGNCGSRNRSTSSISTRRRNFREGDTIGRENPTSGGDYCRRSHSPGIAPGELGAGHDLDLVEHHQRQDDEAQGVAGKQQIRHRDPGDKALFRAAEYDRDLILSREAETASGKRSDHQRESEQTGRVV